MRVPDDKIQWFYETFDEIFLAAAQKRFLIKKSRLQNLEKAIQDFGRAYKKALVAQENWRQKEWIPTWNEIINLAGDKGKITLHARPTHKFESNKGWWEYKFEKYDGRWHSSFNWINEPTNKLHFNLGQRFYELNQYKLHHYNHRVYLLEGLLERLLVDFCYSKYSYQDLKGKTGKILKINLLGDSYWFKVGFNEHGIKSWQKLAWRTETEEIDL